MEPPQKTTRRHKLRAADHGEASVTHHNSSTAQGPRRPRGWESLTAGKPGQAPPSSGYIHNATTMDVQQGRQTFLQGPTHQELQVTNSCERISLSQGRARQRLPKAERPALKPCTHAKPDSCMYVCACARTAGIIKEGAINLREGSMGGIGGRKGKAESNIILFQLNYFKI